MSSQTLTFQNDACCLTCGYLLRDLPTDTCPECGRDFDPLDAATFDIAGQSRKRRRVKQVFLLIGLGLLLYALLPRGIMRANINLTCSVCGKMIAVKRWEAKAPRWIPVRYPGINRTRTIPARTASSVAECDKHSFKVAVRSDLPIGGRVTASASFVEGLNFTYNGVRVTPKTLPQVLRALLAPGNNGIGP